MNKLTLIISVFLLLTPSALAELTCDDSDSGPEDITKPLPFITQAGTVKTLNETNSDFCIEKEGSNDLEQESLWLREYYCYAGKAKSKDYQCFSYGYTKCKMADGIGRCVEGIKADWENKEEKNVTKNVTESKRNCGDDVVQSGEDCDPPGKLCVSKNDEPGVCSDFCICIPYEFKSNVTKPNVTAEEINVSIGAEMADKANKTEAELSEDTKKVLEDIKDDRPLKFNESLGYKLTRGIADSVKHFFAWIGSLFKGD